MNLRNSRIKIIMLFYMLEINKCTIEEGFENCNYLLEKCFEDFEIELCSTIKLKIVELDKIILENLENYTLNRLNLIDLQILRLAIFEMLYTETHINIIIDSAIKLSKEITETDDFLSSKFNNKILDKVGKKVRETTVC